MQSEEREGVEGAGHWKSETKYLNRLGCKINSNSEPAPLWGAKVLLGLGLRRSWVPGQKSRGTVALGDQPGEERGEGQEGRGGARVFFSLQLKSPGRLCYITRLCVEEEAFVRRKGGCELGKALRKETLGPPS